jgi:hypothetical protein
MSVLSSKSFELTQYNDSDQIVNGTINRNYQYPIATIGDSTYMTIQRFSIPASSQQILYVENDELEKFKVSMSVDFVEGLFDPIVDHAIYKHEVSTYLYTSAQSPYYSPSDFVENVDKALHTCYSKLCQSIHPKTGEYYAQLTLTDIDFNHANSYTQSFSVNIKGSKIIDVELSLKNISCLNYVQGQIFQIYVQHPDNTTCLVGKIYVSEGELVNQRNNNLVNKLFKFSDVAIKPMSITNNIDDIKLNWLDETEGLIAFYQPVQSFYETFRNKSANGTWKVKIIPINDITGPQLINLGVEVGDCVLKVTHSVQAISTFQAFEFPPIAPFITLNKSTQFFSFNVHEKFFKSGIQLKMGSRLKSILQVTKNISENNEYIDFPYQKLSTGLNEILVIEQHVPRLFMCSDIEELIVTSNMNIEKDYLDTAFTNTITSFYIDSDLMFKLDNLIFSETLSSVPFRKYRMKDKNLNLSNINLDFYIKLKNGKLKPVQLLPMESLNLRLCLFEANL